MTNPVRSWLHAIAFMWVSVALQASLSARAAEPTDQKNAPDQLEIGRAYERAGFFEDAEVAYRKVLETGSSSSRDDALESLSRVSRLRTSKLVNLAAGLEKGEHTEEASAVYLSVLKEGGPEFQLAAIEGLKRISAKADAETPRLLIDAARHLRELGRWEDSEELYQKALEGTSDAQRKEALEGLKEVSKIRASFVEEYVRPPRETFFKGIVSGGLIVGLTIALIATCGWLLRFIFRRVHRNHLSIADFGTTGTLGSPGKTFNETLALVHQKMRAQSESRALVAERGRMPVLLGSTMSPTLELMGGVNESIVPFAKWYSSVTRQPGYQISGWTEATWWDIKICVTLEHSGNAIGQWRKTCPITEWFSAEQDLAYEVIARLKEYTNAHAA